MEEGKVDIVVAHDRYGAAKSLTINGQDITEAVMSFEVADMSKKGGSRCDPTVTVTVRPDSLLFKTVPASEHD